MKGKFMEREYGILCKVYGFIGHCQPGMQAEHGGGEEYTASEEALTET